MTEKPRVPDYRAALAAFVQSYRGTRYRTVCRAPEVFGFYQALFSDPRVPRHARPTISAVLACFVVTDDVMPEEDLGPEGLLDDLFVAAHAFRQLRREVGGHILLEAWKGEGDLESVMDEVYADGRGALGKKARDVIRLAGL